MLSSLGRWGIASPSCQLPREDRWTEAETLREYPRLEPEDMRAALTYAASVLAQEDVFPLSTPA